MKFRPCIDLHKGKVKQIVGGTYSDADDTAIVTNFETAASSVEFAEKYLRDKLYGGHVIMLGAGNEKAALNALRAFPGGLHIGGGLTPENVSPYLDAGASHVIMTSYIFSNGRIQYEKLKAAVDTVGKNRLVLDLSCCKYDGSFYIVTDRWQKRSSAVITKELLESLSQSCDEFLVHCADTEGLQGGIEQELVVLLGNSSPCPVTYAGGVRTLDDMNLIALLGNDRVDATVGSALDIFGGSMPYAEAAAWHKARNPS